MEYRSLGKAGVQVSVIGLGTNRFGTDVVPQAEVQSIMDAAEDLGINFIDTADIYVKGRSEETLGEALKGRWDRFVLATKFSMHTGNGPNDRGASRYHMMHAVEASLRRLQTDHIDLYYIHRWDERTPVDEMLRGLDDLVRMGKVCYVGASEFAAWQLAEANVLAELRGWSSFAALQSHYHMLERNVEREVLPYCSEKAVGFVPFFPLAGGFLTGKYKQDEPAPVGSRGVDSDYVQGYMTDANYEIVEKLMAWSADHDRGLHELAHAWLLAQPSVCSVISGVTKLEQMQSNAKAADWVLTDTELEEINTILEG
jgi:aryl-alcohol dehydrogenase-like predicted oxidoreductase